MIISKSVFKFALLGLFSWCTLPFAKAAPLFSATDVALVTQR